MMRISATLKRTFSLYSAQVLNLFLGWAIAKINITYLSVQQYGEYTFFITLANFLYVFFTFGVFESSSRLIAYADNEREYRSLAGGTLLLGLAFYTLFAVFFGATHWVIDSVFKIHISHLIAILFPLAGMYLLVAMWQLVLRGSGKIYRLSLFMFLPRIIYILFLIALIYAQMFILENTLALNFVSILIILVPFVLWERPRFTNLAESLRKLWKETRRFGVHMYWSELIKVFLYHTDKLLIPFFLSADQLAYYSLAFMITFPLTFFSTALSTTLYRNFSAKGRIEKKIVLINAAWVILSVAAMVVLKKWIIFKLFSSEYAASVRVVPVLAVAFGFGGLGKIYSYFLTVKGEGKILRNISMSILFIHIALNVILIPVFGIIGAAWASLFSYGLDFVLSFIVYQYRYPGHSNSLLE